ncbi:hypothetical protein DEA8626_00152 [Defluviimonas aquaemixtae]|uniref:Uncharacterized protein n=1 Tax=Albidovulum aquaemixtae TaxID=1542388 RepID=A0A2R8B1Y2_9RHOB|nr:hypothetical protein [Defluviimonas aquaemixtae]SPH16641.1 hypothetical protein DEA8626_00152 [Defluviimonas aquaemixtae]
MIKNLTISTLALFIAAPAFAATQAERSVGVESGVYTLSQIADIAGAERANEAARLKSFYTSSGSDVSRAAFSATATPVTDRGNQSSDR